MGKNMGTSCTISVLMESMDHGVQRKLPQIVTKYSGDTAIRHVPEELLWDHLMLVELVLMDPAYNLWVLLLLWIIVVAEIVVAAGISAMTHQLMVVFLLGQSGS